MLLPIFPVAYTRPAFANHGPLVLRELLSPQVAGCQEKQRILSRKEPNTPTSEPPSDFVNQVFLDTAMCAHECAIMNVFSLAAFSLQWQCGVIATELGWPLIPPYPLSGLLQKRSANP